MNQAFEPGLLPPRCALSGLSHTPGTIAPRALAPLAAAVMLATAAVASAQSAAPADGQADTGEQQLETITVIGTRTERSLREVDATISVYSQEDIERRLVRDIQDLVRFEPGISVGGTGSRFGLEGFTIRGIGGNRVLTLVDGIRVPEEFSFGPFLSARRDFVDVDTISRIEIARGPVSTLYGSDALGGVVAVTTRAPNDYVSDADNSYIDFKTGYSSEDDSLVGSVNAALGNDTLAALVTYSYRDGQETETTGSVGGQGQGRTQADPQENSTRTIGFKLAYSPADGHNFVAAVDQFTGTVDTVLLSDFGVVTRGTRTDSRVSSDERERSRYSLSYRYDQPGGWVDSALVTLYQQSSETEQLTFENQTAPGFIARTRQRSSAFEQNIDGLLAQGTSSLTVGPTEHTLTYGIDVYRTSNEALRTGFTRDVASGALVPEFNPLPTRDFPNTEVENRAFFLQDEIVMFDGRLRVTPGLRFDDFEANTNPDDIYFSGNPGVQAPADFGDSELTMKLGALYQLTDSVAAWARYSEGFRAPPYDDVNVGFSNFLGGYKTIAAPELASETSAGVELGLRVSSHWGEAQFAAFNTVYDNFIEANVVAPAFAGSGGIDPRDGLLTFQSINRGEVEIRGLEFRGRVALGALANRLSSFSIEAAAAYAHGETDAGTPINTVDPLNAVLGLSWAPPTRRFSAELLWTWADDKDAADIDGPRMGSESFSVFDALLHYELSDRISLDAGVFNLLDEQYIRWADTIGIGEDAAQRFTRPGRNFSITLRASL